jgi:hypothetical protein
MPEQTPISLDAFLAAPLDEVRSIVPETVIYTPGGTRRRAALNGIVPHSEAYAQWARARLVACCELLFHYGVRHICLTAIWPRQYAEVGPYREKNLRWTNWGIAGSEAIADWERLQCRVRIIGHNIPAELNEAHIRLRETTDSFANRTIWWSVNCEYGGHWAWAIEAAARCNARTQAELVNAMYGEPIPFADLWLGFGKPMISPDLIPAILLHETQCYWLQQPGYELDEPTLRLILYDYAYTRKTWWSDKTRRYENVSDHRDVWDNQVILGVGQRVGHFWYPQANGDEQ